MNKKQLFINIFSSIFGFVMSFAISFFLSPYIIKTIGREAYGFFSLGNQFISYATVVTTALNSMASRFITIKIYQNDKNGRDRYFSSVIISNIILTLVLLIPSILVVLFLEKLLSVPNDILLDVKLLWTFLFVSFFMGIIMNVYSIATFAKNKLYLNSIRNVESGIINALILVLLFGFFQPAIWYLGFAAILCQIYKILFNIRYTNKFLPDIKCKREYFDIDCVKELLSSGIWNSFTKLAGILNNGLDLLISNLFVSASAMGMLSIAKLIPTYLSQVLALLSSTFLPELTKNYAKKDKVSLLGNIKFARSITSTAAATVVALLIVYGDAFFRLWLPNENATALQIVSISGLIVYIFIGSIGVLGDVIMLANKQKMVAITYFIAGILNLLIVFPTLYFIEKDFLVLRALGKENAKLLVISGVSGGISIIRNLVFTPIYAARCLSVKWYSFYPLIVKNVVGTIVVVLVASLIRNIYPADSWVSFFGSGFISGAIGLVINALFLFDKEQLFEIIRMGIQRLKLKKG